MARLVPALLVLASLAVTAPTASAQEARGGLTVESLIGDSVSDPGAARYSDVEQAIRRFQNRDQLSARTFLERAVQNNSKLPPVGVLLAKMQLLSGNGAGVRAALEQAVQEDSADDPEPFLLLGEQALAGGRTIEADALFDRAVSAIESYDENAKRKRLFQIRAYRGRAVIADRRRKFEQAEADIRRWLELDPEDARAHSQLGQALFMLEKPAEGYDAFVKAKELDDDLPNPFVSAALMYGRLGDTEKAMASFQRASREEPANATNQVAYAQALMKAGKQGEAAAVLDSARKSGESVATVLLLSGVNERMRGNLEQAEARLSEAMAQAPSNRDVLNQLALLLLDTPGEGDRARAEQFARMNQQLNPNNPDVNITLAWVLFQAGNAREANTALRQGLQGGALSPDGSFLVAKMLLERDDRTNAENLLKSALASKQGIFVNREEAERLLRGL